MSEFDLGKTQLKQIEQYQDRWSSLGAQTGLIGISDQLSVDQLREFEIFREFDDRVLAKISQDVSVATWQEGAVLFEEGSFVDLAFMVVDGEVEVYLEGVGGGQGPRPIFDASRTMVSPAPAQSSAGDTDLISRTTSINLGLANSTGTITFLATMDFDLPRGAAARLGPGEIFGEIGALSGWPQSVTARTASICRLLQIRLPALRVLKRKSKALKKRLDASVRCRPSSRARRSSPAATTSFSTRSRRRSNWFHARAAR